MGLSVNRLCFSLNPKIINHNKSATFFDTNLPCRARAASFPIYMRYEAQVKCKRISLSNGKGNRNCVSAICAISTDAKYIGISSQFEGFSVTVASNTTDKELKISVEVTGDKTGAIFEDVFAKMVAAAQPIPGFRRVKGGKTPNIPRDILLEVLGPSRVYGQVIKKIISSTIAEYTKKEGLKVYKDLKVEQSFNDLEATFEPSEEFRFDAVVRLVD